MFESTKLIKKHSNAVDSEMLREMTGLEDGNTGDTGVIFYYTITGDHTVYKATICSM